MPGLKTGNTGKLLNLELMPLLTKESVVQRVGGLVKLSQWGSGCRLVIQKYASHPAPF